MRHLTRREGERHFLRSPSPLFAVPIGVAFEFPVITGTLTGLAFLGPRHRVYFYAPATTTDKTVYGDNSLMTQHSNPVLCDKFGNLPPIWTAEGESYLVVIKNEHDVLKYQETI